MRIMTMAVRNVLRNSRRTALSLGAIGVAMFAITGMFAFLEGINADMEKNVKTWISGDVRIRHRDFDKNEAMNPLGMAVDDWGAIIEDVEATGEVAAASPRIAFGTAIYRNGKNYAAIGMGVDFAREEGIQGLSGRLTAGAIPSSDKKEVLVGEGLAREAKLQVGDKITMQTQTRSRGTNAITFVVSGIAKFPYAGFNDQFFMGPIDRIDSLLKMKGGVTEILLFLKPGISPEDFAAGLNEKRFGNSVVEAKSWTKIGQSYSMIRIIDSMEVIIAFFFLILGSTVIINTTLMTVYERTREIGTLSALGMRGGEIVRLFFAESFLIGSVGAILGGVLAIAALYPLSKIGLDLSAIIKDMEINLSDRLYPIIDLKTIISALAYAALVASITSLIPSRHAAKIEPIEALRTI